MTFFYNLNEIAEHVAPEPYTRYAKVLFDSHDNAESPLSIGYFRLEPGGSGPKHHHENEVEVYIVIKGKGKVTLGEQDIEVQPGTLVYVPPKMEHQTCNTGTAALEFYGIFSPAVDFSEIRSWPLSPTVIG